LASSYRELNKALLAGFRSEEAVAVLQPVMDELAGIDDEAAIVRLGATLSAAYALHQDTQRALVLVDEFVARAERIDLVDVVTELIMRRGMLLGQLGRNYEAIALTKGAIDLAEENGFVDTALSARANLGFHLAERDPAKAMALDRETLAEAHRLGMRRRMLLILGNVSEDARFTGDWDWALGLLETQLAGDLDVPDRGWFLGNALVLRGWRGEATAEDWAAWDALIEGEADPQAAADYKDIHALRALGEGRLADARRIAIEGAGMIGGRVPSRRAVAARAAIWSQDPIGAAEDLAAIHASAMRGPAIELRRTTIRAGITALEGRTAESIALYREARDGWRDVAVPWEEALTGIDMATVLDSLEPEVQTAAARSREILTNLRAAPFLQRLEASLARVPGTGGRVVRREAETRDRTAV
jgi:hypothetical protein